MEEEKIEEKKKSNAGLIIFLVVLVLGLAGYICYDKIFTKYDSNSKEKGKQPTPAEEKIDFDATKYLGYVPLEKNSYIYQCSWGNIECYDVDEYLDAYSKDKVTIDDISDRLLFNMALSYSKKASDNEKFESDFEICGKDSNGNKLKCTVADYYKATEVLSNVKKLYNKDITPQDFPVPAGYAYYKNNYFALGFGAGNTPVEKVSNMESAEIVNGDLIIEERAIFVFYDGIDMHVVKKTNYNSNDDELKGSSNSESWDSEEASKYAYQNIDKSNLFKHTFKKNNSGDYYWYSTEIVK